MLKGLDVGSGADPGHGTAGSGQHSTMGLVVVSTLYVPSSLQRFPPNKTDCGLLKLVTFEIRCILKNAWLGNFMVVRTS